MAERLDVVEHQRLNPAPVEAFLDRAQGSADSQGCRIDSAHQASPHDSDTDEDTDELEETFFTAHKGFKGFNVSELWSYRRLLYFFIWRDLKVRYKQTILGAAWAILQPVMMMVVFAVFLGRFAGVSSGDLPYPVFLYAGLLPWTLFSAGLSRSGNSVVGASRFINKVYFPRLLIPFAAVGPAIIDFAIAFGVLFVLMLSYGIVPGWTFLLAPLPILMLVMASLAGGIVLAALNVSYRDFRYAIPFFIQLLMFATPAIYMDVAAKPAAASTDVAVESTASEPGTVKAASAARGRGRHIPDSLRWLVTWNPLTGMIHFFRAATLGGELPWKSLGFSFGIISVVFLLAAQYFRHAEDSFADIL